MDQRADYIVEIPSGEIIWINKYEKRVLSDHSLIRYEAIKNIWLFRSNKRKEIEEILRQERYLSSK